MNTKRIKKIAMALAAVLAVGVITVSGTLHVEAASLKSQINKIVKNNTTTSENTSTEQVLEDNKANLKSLFAYVEETYGYKRYTGGVPTKKNWQKTFAAEMLKEKKGSCYHFAALYAYLAVQSTGYKVRIGLGKTKGFGNKNQLHAWTEVKIGKTWYICDTNMDKFAAKSSGKYFLKKRSSSAMKKVYYKYKGVKYIDVKKL